MAQINVRSHLCWMTNHLFEGTVFVTLDGSAHILLDRIYHRNEITHS